MMTKVLQWLLAILVAGGIVAAVFVVGKGGFFRTNISVAVVERGKAIDAVAAVVEVRAKREIDLRSELAGRVSESKLEIGTKVEAGEVLLRLDDTDLQRERDRVRLDLEAEESARKIGSPLRFDLEEVKEEQKRRERLFAEGRISQRELDEQNRRVARLTDEMALNEIWETHRLETLRSELERIDSELEKLEVRAPENGTVLEVFAYPDDLISPRGIVARLLSDKRVIEASLSEENFAGVEPEQPVTVRFLSYGRRLFEGKVAEIFPAADPDTQRYKIWLDLDMAEELMIPGITGEASIILGERDGSLLIPRRALIGRDVFVIRDGVAELQRVELGFIGLNTVEIVSGLAEGEEVAVENLDRLRDGDRVRF